MDISSISSCVNDKDCLGLRYKTSSNNFLSTDTPLNIVSIVSKILLYSSVIELYIVAILLIISTFELSLTKLKMCFKIFLSISNLESSKLNKIFFISGFGLHSPSPVISYPELILNNKNDKG